jgi:tetratricopeptide (TPR) repeat protein
MAQSAPMRDRYDLPLSTASATALDLYIDGVDRAFSGNIHAELKLSEAIEADEGFAMAHAALAAHQSRIRIPQAARENAARAKALSAGLSRRERQHIDIIHESLTGSGETALKLSYEHLDDFPSDAAILQLFTGLMTGSGTQERIALTLDEIERREAAYGDDWFYLGLRSFYLHESNRFQESRQFAERSLQGNPRNGNACHNMAHVFYETSDYEGGLDFLNDWIVGYSPTAPFFSHLNWHMALFELTQGRYGRAQDIYDECIRPSVLEARGGLGPPLADAKSYLWRLELYGKGVNPRDWQEVRAFAADHARSPGVSFQDAHAALALAATHDDVAMTGLIDALGQIATRGNSFVEAVVLPLVRGIEAFGRGAYAETIAFIEPIDDRIVAIGGSQAQRAVFHETLLEAYLRTGSYEQAEVMLRKRLEHRHTGRDFFWLAQAQSRSGKLDDARSNALQARKLWSGAEPNTPELISLKTLVG